jgi:hypothetical protein
MAAIARNVANNVTKQSRRVRLFRHLARVARGELPPESLLEVQERDDNHFLRHAGRDRARHQHQA